jgi:hypothetical protein
LSDVGAHQLQRYSAAIEKVVRAFNARRPRTYLAKS